MYKIKSTIIYMITSVFVIACTFPTVEDNNSYYGKWRLNTVVYDDGDFKDLSNKAGHFINFSKTEVSEIMAAYGVRTYPYIQESDVFIVTYASGKDTWTIVESSEHSMQIDAPNGRYVFDSYLPLPSPDPAAPRST
jgi:hypothetical protein